MSISQNIARKFYRWTTIFILFFSFTGIHAQDIYWVFFTDKANTEFDPYRYFDPKAIERRAQLGLSLHDSTDFPLNASYVDQVSRLSEEVIGHTRWFNGMAVSTYQITEIQKLPFVKSVVFIQSEGELAACHPEEILVANHFEEEPELVLPQVARMGGEAFVAAGIDGKGRRIAILDGGFPNADKHDALRHVFDNHQVIKTYNFPARKENVYGWNSHGTMVFSCIAGIEYDRKMGMATGAEFLLARTEIGMEPRKEEVWWMMGMEWADQNGADIISSSLGYGKDRYQPTQMDGTSLVARAANMAAAKGILVCNSAGNEGSDKSWRTIITPADADSVLTVGGINSDGTPSNFTSIGPSSDGRLKPNVAAYGTVTAANPSSIHAFSTVSGTSFSCPLTAGFAACAWQLNPNLTNMELMREIERSGDMYPYFDYTYGYGVPQASYFIDKKKESKSPIAIITRNELTQDYTIEIPEDKAVGGFLFYEAMDQDDRILFYGMEEITPDHRSVEMTNPAGRYATGSKIRCLYHGAVTEQACASPTGPHIAHLRSSSTYYHTPATDKVSTRGVCGKWNLAPYLTWGFIIPQHGNHMEIKGGPSESFNFGLRFKGNIVQWYSLGGSVEIGASWFRFNKRAVANKADGYYLSPECIGIDDMPFQLRKDKVRTSVINLEFYQRFRLMAGGLFHYGLFIDTGIYGGLIFSNRYKGKILFLEDDGARDKRQRGTYSRAINNADRFQWGVRLRLGFDIVAIYAQYRFNDITHPAQLPNAEVGVQLTMPIGN